MLKALGYQFNYRYTSTSIYHLKKKGEKGRASNQGETEVMFDDKLKAFSKFKVIYK